MKKVIFLDIDGVLNTERFILSMLTKDCNGNYHGHEYLTDEYGTLFDPISVKNLGKIIKLTDAKIVISSTWRYSGLEKIKEMWHFRNIPGEVIDITPIHWELKNNPLNGTPYEKWRGNEIQIWLNENKDVSNYLIIDDDNDMLPSQIDNFVNTNQYYGISSNNKRKAVQILNKNKL